MEKIILTPVCLLACLYSEDSVAFSLQLDIIAESQTLEGQIDLYYLHNSACSFCIFRGTEIGLHSVSTKEQKPMQTM